MKKIPALCALLIGMAGCGLANSAYLVRNHERGKIVTATIGTPLIQAERGVKNDVYGSVLDRFEKQFIYSGKAGSVVKFSYREFAGKATFNEDSIFAGPTSEAGSLARPAFTQEVQYDLNDGDTIAFQSMRLRVVNATNSEITVEVLSELAL